MIARKLAAAIALAALILGAAAGLRYAQGEGMIEAETARRTMQILVGLVLAGYANLMPKQIGRGRSPLAEAQMMRVLRVGGWSFTLAGLAYAGLWAFAPLPVADVASVAVVVCAMAITLGYAGRSMATCARGKDEAVSR